MPKVFYTQADIEDMVRRGVTSLAVNDNVVLTDLAYEKAVRLGLTLVRDQPDNPPGAPVRPYLSQPPSHRPMEAISGRAASGVPTSAAGNPPGKAPSPAAQPASGDLAERIRSAVVARLGNQVDLALLDAIIQRVLASTGVK